MLIIDIPKNKFDTSFINSLKENLAKLHSNKPTLVTGDFNYDVLKYEVNPIINEFLDTILQFSSTYNIRTLKNKCK